MSSQFVPRGQNFYSFLKEIFKTSSTLFLKVIIINIMWLNIHIIIDLFLASSNFSIFYLQIF